MKFQKQGAKQTEMDNENPDISIQISCSVETAETYLDKFKSLASDILAQFEIAMADLSIAIVDDAGIIGINQRFLDRDTATDVISFDLTDPDEDRRTFDIVINADQAKRQSELRGHSLEAELALYITHGLLHNLGFDDQSEELATQMHKKEDEILQNAGYGVIYARADKDNQSKGR